MNPENLDPKLHSFWEGVDLHGIAVISFDCKLS